MGVYIPNISKPKECIECEFSCLWVNDSTYCMVDGVELFCDGIPQRHDCPLIEIPTPHGRLIDWDAFNSKLEIQYAEGRGKTLAPTILEEEP